jgi:hypothetical protein
MAKYIRAVTPAGDSQHAASLCAELSPSEQPFYVDVRPIIGEPVNECFHVVNRHLEKFGGLAVIGWAIWELPTVFVEAEFHAIWKSPDGVYLDVAPKSTPTQRVLFLPDYSRTYDGYPLDNIRRPISSAPEVRNFFRALGAKYELMNRGGRAREHGEVCLRGSEVLEYHRIEGAIAQFGEQVQARYPSVGPYMPCPCGSGKKFKWCHRPA